MVVGRNDTMKTNGYTFPLLWLLSCAIFFLLGEKLYQPTDRGFDSADNMSSRRSRENLAPSDSETRQFKISERRGPSLSQDDLTLAAASLAQNDDPLSRTNEIVSLISQLKTADYPEVVSSFIEQNLNELRKSEYYLLLSAWAARDPLGALEFCEVNKVNRFDRITILRSWSSYNATSAAQWIETSDALDYEKDWDLLEIINGAATTDPLLATEIMTRLTRPNDLYEALRGIAPAISRQGFEKASQWVENLPENASYNGIRFLATNLSNQDIAGTADWIRTLPDSQGKGQAVADLANKWSESDSGSALNWAEALSGANRTAALLEVIPNLVRDDVNAAARWLDTKSSDSAYPTLSEKFARAAAEIDIELARKYMPSIESN